MHMHRYHAQAEHLLCVVAVFPHDTDIKLVAKNCGNVHIQLTLLHLLFSALLCCLMHETWRSSKSQYPNTMQFWWFAHQCGPKTNRICQNGPLRESLFHVIHWIVAPVCLRFWRQRKIGWISKSWLFYQALDVYWFTKWSVILIGA